MNSQQILPGDSQSPQDSSATPPRLRVVIVEDEAIIALELEMMLEDLGAEVVGVAMNAADADALVAAHRPDLVTMDINIKGDRDGISAAEEILLKHGVRAIFISAYSDAATRVRAAACDAIGWITKPVEQRDLAKALNRLKRRET